MIEIVEQLVPDVVITDIQMPEMDGVVATNNITENHPQVGVIALSMFNDEVFFTFHFFTIHFHYLN